MRRVAVLFVFIVSIWFILLGGVVCQRDASVPTAPPLAAQPLTTASDREHDTVPADNLLYKVTGMTAPGAGLEGEFHGTKIETTWGGIKAMYRDAPDTLPRGKDD